MTTATAAALRSSRREPNEDPSDAALLALIERGDEGGFAVLLARWWGPLIQYCRAIVKAELPCDDIVQEAFVRLWERRGRWRPQSSVRAILYTMVRNRAWNELRRAGNQERNLCARRGALHGRVVTPAEEMDGLELRAALDSAIAELSPRRREILLLSREEGLTHAEIAEITGLSTQVVANYLFRALDEVRRKVAPLLES